MSQENKPKTNRVPGKKEQGIKIDTGSGKRGNARKEYLTNLGRLTKEESDAIKGTMIGGRSKQEVARERRDVGIAARKKAAEKAKENN